jgi:hypothetical protein
MFVLCAMGPPTLLRRNKILTVSAPQHLWRIKEVQHVRYIGYGDASILADVRPLYTSMRCVHQQSAVGNMKERISPPGGRAMITGRAGTMAARGMT